MTYIYKEYNEYNSFPVESIHKCEQCKHLIFILTNLDLYNNNFVSIQNVKMLMNKK